MTAERPAAAGKEKNIKTIGHTTFYPLFIFIVFVIAVLVATEGTSSPTLKTLTHELLL